MTSDTQTKIRKLAESLKEKHLATTMEEALERAKRIIEESGAEQASDVKEASTELKKAIDKEQEELKEIHTELKEIKDVQTRDALNSEELKEQARTVNKELEEIKKDASKEAKHMEKASKTVADLSLQSERDEHLHGPPGQHDWEREAPSPSEHRAGEEVRDEPVQSRGEVKEPEDKEYHEKQ